MTCNIAQRRPAKHYHFSGHRQRAGRDMSSEFDCMNAVIARAGLEEGSQPRLDVGSKV